MPTPNQSRIAEAMTRPRILQLWQALQPLKSVVRFMNSGAHPDDETSAMLAALRFRDGIDISYTCSTRGEGGQNDIGTEAGADLGALRTAEMERAAEALQMRMYWLSEGPDDPITDFGFSKSGVETLGKWGRDRTLARFVQIVRTERPDILCPTFLDIPGQHGHHRAMTEMASDVMSAAADTGFASNLPVWQVAKLYLPAWSGAGGAYDDEVPPPPTTLVIDASGVDPVSGWSFEQIGQQSRAFHRTQGMGRWVPAGTERDWPLHLAVTHVDGPDETLSSGLPGPVLELGPLGGGAFQETVYTAQGWIDETMVSFPDFAKIAVGATKALKAVRDSMRLCPGTARDQVLHRLFAKERQLALIIRIASGVEAMAAADRVWVRSGQSFSVATEIRASDADEVAVTLDLPEGWSETEGVIEVGQMAAMHDTYRDSYDPASPPLPNVIAQVTVDGVTSETRAGFVVPPVVLPPRSARLDARVVLNRTLPLRSVEVALTGQVPALAEPRLDLPQGWRAEPTEDGFRISLPGGVANGLYTLTLSLSGEAALTESRIDYPHIRPTMQTVPARVQVRVLDVSVPKARVGYVGAGNDRVAHWLRAVGVEVEDVSDEALASASGFSGYNTVIVGIFAFRFRPGLYAAIPALHAWVNAGGNLVTLYHRPWDNWDPDTVPPARLEIGQPSLRWRVTDERAAVTVLAPDHPLLTRPNRIEASDWDGWHKERGLYFAKSWDALYQPLLELSDPGEAPLRGALLAGRIGQGRHIHTSLILHHQMERLVPGAFRLMANLIAQAE